MDMEAALAEHLAGLDGPDGWDAAEYDTEPARPETAERADRILWRLRTAERELESFRELVAARKAQLDAWLADMSRGPERVIAYCERALEGYARYQHELSGGRTVTFKLPNGVLKLTKPQGKLIVDDEAELLAVLDQLAAEHMTAGEAWPELVRTERNVRVAELKKVATWLLMEGDELEGADPDYDHYKLVIDGELIPGAHLQTPRQRTFKQTPPTAAGDTDTPAE